MKVSSIKLKKRLLSLISLLSMILVYAQENHSYTGSYLFDNGKATYHYYEGNDLERIYDGKFEFQSKNYAVVGYYKQNLKDGLWIYNKFDTSAYTKAKTKIIIKGLFKNGFMDGLWSYQKISWPRKKVLRSSTCDFTLGLPSGSYSYSDSSITIPVPGDEFNISATGKFDSTGRRIGKWVTKYNKYFSQGIAAYQEIREYINDDKVRIIRRELNNGTVEVDTADAFKTEFGEIVFSVEYGERLNWERYLSFWQCENKYASINCPGNDVFSVLNKGSIFINLDKSKTVNE